MSLNFPLVPREVMREILPEIEDRLLTSRGLKTLSSDDIHYRSTYGGSMAERDLAYHQGTIWPWLFGPFITAYIRAFPESKEVKTNCKYLLDSYIDKALGEDGYDLPEIYEAESLEPRGCIAQAWTVAQVLEAYSQLAMRYKVSL